MKERVFYTPTEDYTEIRDKACENLKKAGWAEYNHTLTEFLKGLTLDEIMQMYIVMMYNDLIGFRLNIIECINQEILYRSMIGFNEENEITIQSLDRAEYYGYAMYLLEMVSDEKLDELKSFIFTDDVVGTREDLLNKINKECSSREQNKQYKLKK